MHIFERKCIEKFLVNGTFCFSWFQQFVAMKFDDPDDDDADFDWELFFFRILNFLRNTTSSVFRESRAPLENRSAVPDFPLEVLCFQHPFSNKANFRFPTITKPTSSSWKMEKAKNSQFSFPTHVTYGFCADDISFGFNFGWGNENKRTNTPHMHPEGIVYTLHTLWANFSCSCKATVGWWRLQ